MSLLDTYTATFPDATKDVRLNLTSVLQAAAPLSTEQLAVVALAAAYNTRDTALILAVRSAIDVGDRRTAVDADAQAAAALMAMNNVFYRTRHQLGATYESTSPRLRMNRMLAPATDAGTFELASLAVSAINGCHVCVQAHEQSVRKHGLGEDHVVQAVRVAAVVASAAVARVAALPD